MKILITGYSGQLGYDVFHYLEKHNIEKNKKYKILGTSSKDFNLLNERETKDFIKNYNPDIIIHSAAYTAVDNAEDDVDNCYKINIDGTRYIAETSKEINAKLVYISTDYVFDGKKMDCMM